MAAEFYEYIWTCIWGTPHEEIVRDKHLGAISRTVWPSQITHLARFRSSRRRVTTNICHVIWSHEMSGVINFKHIYCLIIIRTNRGNIKTISINRTTKDDSLCWFNWCVGGNTNEVINTCRLRWDACDTYTYRTASAVFMGHTASTLGSVRKRTSDWEPNTNSNYSNNKNHIITFVIVNWTSSLCGAISCCLRQHSRHFKSEWTIYN